MNDSEPTTEVLQAELAKYKGIDSEWLLAYRKLCAATTDAEEAEAYNELEALRTRYSWTEMGSEPVLKVVVEQRDEAQAKVQTLRVQLKLLIAYLQTDTHSAGQKLAKTEKQLRELVENL